ncbi:MAG: SiaB family protein kinase [Cyclobacteriaceae bacterium]|jgi:glucose-6-phosphate-specific signal transduction histidine kinase
MKYVYDLHKSMRDQNLILVYEGEFTQEITKSVLAMAERNMDSMGEDSSVKRKVFNVMVECLQNIVKHGEGYKIENEYEYNAVFMIGKKGDEYIIASGNPLESNDIPGLKDRLDKVNSLDKDGLKQLYKEIIKNTTISEKGGAGLGFVDMARKSGSKLEYDFVEIEGGRSFFSLKTTIGRN